MAAVKGVPAMGKTRAKVVEALALERELVLTQPQTTVPGKAKSKSAGGTATISSASAASTSLSSTVSAVTPAGTSLVTAANDDYEASKVTKKSSRTEKDDERNMVADLDRWNGIFQLPENLDGASLEDSF